MKNKRTVISLLLILTFVISMSCFQVIAFADNAGLKDKDNQPIVNLKKDSTELELEKEHENDVKNLLMKRENALKTGDYTDYYTELKIYAKKWKASSNIKQNNVNGISANSLVMYQYLGVTKKGQEETYYCGPASAYQLLKYKGINSNPNDGRSTTQDNLADDLHTDEDGTPFTGWWETTLEDWTNISWYPLWSPTEMGKKL